ncbi:MAG: UvrD-helicase domain-containing protein [Treponema sp.]|jgi:DNA helicase-2/ATP-dependent DNA helicase PcrA|nr:UvrD-helicase domain-containing protein [Treponema sp.]
MHETPMQMTADLHIHSRFSRATSKSLTPAALDKWGRIKGIDLIGTGDCTHPAWLAELREQLTEAGGGFYTLKSEYGGGGIRPPLFVLTGEISTIYKKGDKTRKVHHLVLLPDFAAAEAFQARLEKLGNIRSDGRPILGLDSRDLLAVLLETDERAVLVPAHIWTPWFSALGARSGFDSIDECYGDMARYIPAIETGLSSNPPMNWALASLDRFSIISNSDAHSPEKLGREATAFSMEPCFASLTDALWRRAGADILYTVEFFPQEGKYHYDGHRKCGVCLNPEEAAGGLCPVCGKPLTMGVMRRVRDCADRPVDERAPCPADYAGTNRRPYLSLIPLRELAGELLGAGPASKKTDLAYESIIAQAGSELAFLIDMPPADAARIKAPGIPGERLAEALTRMRRGEVSVRPGCDGEYGVITVFGEGTREAGNALFAAEAQKSPPQKPPMLPQKSPMPRPEPHSQKSPTSVFTPDAEQEKAIRCESRAVLIAAGPGAGKTATLSARIARLLQNGARPSSIAALTFTVKASRELKERLAKTQGADADVAAVHAATFHSFCAALLTDFFDVRPSILTNEARDALLKDLSGAVKGVPFRALGEYIEARKRFLLLPGEQELSLGAENTDLVRIAERFGLPAFDAKKDSLYRVYQKRLREQNALDFDGLICEAARRLALSKEARQRLRYMYRYIFVDEYQDINFSQYALLRLLTRRDAAQSAMQGADGEQKLWVIGDPNQAIYGFRGSDKRFIDRFLEDYPDAVRFSLSRSFRCAAPIAAAAGRLAGAELRGAEGKAVLCRAAYPSAASEAEGIARRIAALLGGTSFFALDSGTADAVSPAAAASLDSIAILIRAAALAPPLLKALADHGIPCKLIEDADAEVPTQGVRVMTMHASKGLEFEQVFVPALEEGVLPFTLFGGKDSPALERARIEEERRILYVAMTRAKTGLSLSWAKKRVFQSRTLENRPSRFLAEIEEFFNLEKFSKRPPRRQNREEQGALF